MPRSTARPRGAALAPPNEASLHEAALAHLARMATTRARLTAVLTRRVERWRRAASDADAESDAGAGAAQAATVARAAIPSVIARLVAAGLLDDAAFASARAASLTRAGRSRRAVAAHLAVRGIAGEDAAAALPEGDELAAAAATARRRRIGPFRRAPQDADGARRELAALARAGFSQETARAALALGIDAAEALIARLRGA